MKIGILHPGEMGISIAASAIKNGHAVYWLSENRSGKTRERAEKYDLIELDSLEEFCDICELIISICPPHGAEDLANSVVKQGFKGLYLDANAISPKRAAGIGQTLKSAGVDFIDGGIIGGPAWEPKNTWLYLSGRKAEEIASVFAKGPLETKVIGGEIGKASALKMCYAAYSKGSAALLSAVIAVAEVNGVRESLNKQWDMDEDGSSEQASNRVKRVTAKAWRFEGEMREITETFRLAGLPGGFHEAAGEIYHRMAKYKDLQQLPGLEDVLLSLQR